MGWCINLLNYHATNQDAKVRFHVSDMVMNIHSDASYLLETKARSRACGHFSGEPNQLNGAFYVNTTILCFIVASAAEAELGALFHNCQDGIFFDKLWLTWDTHNHESPSIVIMPWQLLSQTTLWKDSVCNLWKWDFWGAGKQRSAGYIWRKLAPGTREFSRLPKQAPHRSSPQKSLPLVLTPSRLTKVFTIGSCSQHSERLCWNPKGWVHT
jgi:hypothetical protein